MIQNISKLPRLCLDVEALKRRPVFVNLNICKCFIYTATDHSLSSSLCCIFGAQQRQMTAVLLRAHNEASVQFKGKGWWTGDGEHSQHGGNMQIISWSATLLFWWLLWSHGIDLTMNYGEVSVTLQNHANEVIIRKEVSVREVLCGKLTVKETGF